MMRMVMHRKGGAMLRRLFSDYKKYIVPFVLSIICATLSTSHSLLVPVLMGQGIDTIVGEGNVDFDALYLILKEMIVSILLSALFQWLMNGINNRIVYGVSNDLRKRAFKSFVNTDLKYIDNHTEGDILSRIIVDCDGISDGLLLGFNQFFVGVVTIVITLIFMLRLNVYLALAVVVMTPLSVLVARFIAKKCNVYFARQAKVRGELTDLSSDIIGLKEVINNDGAEGYFKEIFESKNRENEEISRKATYYSSLTNPLTRLVNAVCYAVVTMGGALLAVVGSITVGGLTSFLAYAAKFAKPFNDISSVVTELQNSLVCLDRIYELIDAEPEREVTNRESTSEDSLALNERIRNESEDAKAECVGTDTSDIEFKNVDFGYNDKNVINDITFTIPKGKKLGVVGESGCGKTTIMKLLLRFYDVGEGSILIGGKDIRDIPVDEVRRMMGLMLQETFIISGSVMDNIRMGNSDATYEEVVKAAKECYAHDFIMNLPKGYDTVVTADNLSEGQRQLICITRLMLRDSRIVLLDEATSSIDILNERLIKTAFDKIMEGKTTVVVAHRLVTVMDSDIILVMDKGRVAEIGSHSELLKNEGVYYNLYNAQKA